MLKNCFSSLVVIVLCCISASCTTVKKSESVATKRRVDMEKPEKYEANMQLRKDSYDTINVNLTARVFVPAFSYDVRTITTTTTKREGGSPMMWLFFCSWNPICWVAMMGDHTEEIFGRKSTSTESKDIEENVRPIGYSWETKGISAPIRVETEPYGYASNISTDYSGNAKFSLSEMLRSASTIGDDSIDVLFAAKPPNVDSSLVKRFKLSKGDVDFIAAKDNIPISARRQIALFRDPNPTPEGDGKGRKKINTSHEIVYWRSVESKDTVEEYQSYLDAFPKGNFAELARSRIENILKQKASAEVAQIKKEQSDKEAKRREQEFEAANAQGEMKRRREAKEAFQTNCQIACDRAYHTCESSSDQQMLTQTLYAEINKSPMSMIGAAVNGISSHVNCGSSRDTCYSGCQ